MNMMNYTIVDFKDLVSMWYNEFLPNVIGDKAFYIKDAGIVYLNSISLEPKKKDSIKFLVKKIMELDNGLATNIIVQEPKAVNNIRLSKFLRSMEIDKTLNEETRNRVLHMANKRYVVTSTDILLSQDKEMDEFLDQVFLVLTKLGLKNTRFLKSGSLGFKDVVDVATQFFPRKSLNIQGNYIGSSIQVSSSSDALSRISIEFTKGKPMDLGTLKFLDKTKESMIDEFRKLV